LTPAATIHELVAINLRFDPSTEALNVRALAQILGKILFAEGRSVSRLPADLAKQASKVFGVPRLALDRVERALRFLQSMRLAKESGRRWMLTDRGYLGIEEDLRRSEERLRSVLQRHFPARVDQVKLENWFYDACIEFYGLYGTQWAAALGKQTTKKEITARTVASLLRDATRKNGLDADMEALADGFHSFLGSQDRDDIDHQWSLGQSLLAAKLVAANIGPDPVTAEDFRRSTLLLDTNTLIVAALESHRLAGPLGQLADALRQLEIRLGVIRETRDEYVHAVAAKKAHVLRVVEAYPPAVLRQSGDPFIDTALARYCHSERDFETFFDQLLDPPTKFGNGLPVGILDDSSIQALAARGRSDERLKREIDSAWNALRSRPKHPKATEHDAALTAVAEGLNASGEKCAVLTLDRTMHEHAVKRAGRNESPRWVSIDALIQVLAVDGSVPTLNPAAFAPLTASIIRHQCEPVLNTYTAEDLGVMLEVEERCAKLPPDEVRKIASGVARSRLSGKRRDDPELQLQVRRAFQARRLEVQDDLQSRLEASNAAVRSRDQQLERESRARSVAQESYIATRVKELRRGAFRVAAAEIITASVLAIGFFFGAFYLTGRLLPEGEAADTVGLLFSLLPPAAAAVAWIWKKALPRWKRKTEAARSVAEKELEERELVAGR